MRLAALFASVAVVTLAATSGCAGPQAEDTDPAETEGPHGTWRTIRSPLRFDGERQTEVEAPPVLGSHNKEVLGRD